MTVKILVCSDKHFASWVIRIGTMSKWSHVGIAFGDVVFDTMLKTGVNIQSLTEFKSKHTHIEEIEIDIPDESAAYDFALAQIGKKYDWTALVGMVIQRNWQETDSWFCSELVEAIIKAGGKQRFRSDVSRITPHQTWAIL